MSRWMWHGHKHAVACSPDAVIVVQKVPEHVLERLWQETYRCQDVKSLTVAIDSVIGYGVSAGVAMWNGAAFECAVRGRLICQDGWALTGQPAPRQTIQSPNVTTWTYGVNDGERLSIGERGDLAERHYSVGTMELIAGWGYASIVMADRPHVDEDEDDNTIVGVDWDDDRTYSNTPHVDVATSEGTSSSPTSGITSLRCPQGHDNPPAVRQCLTCGQSMEDATLVTIAQPVIGHVRLPSGRIVDIKDDIVLGRMPQGLNRHGRSTPLLVPVASPRALISRTHCEIRVDGWDAYVIDHQSNNGTFLLREGQQPQQVLPGKPVRLQAGDSIDLGEGVHVDIGDVV